MNLKFLLSCISMISVNLPRIRFDTEVSRSKIAIHLHEEQWDKKLLLCTSKRSILLKKHKYL